MGARREQLYQLNFILSSHDDRDTSLGCVAHTSSLFVESVIYLTTHIEETTTIKFCLLSIDIDSKHISCKRLFIHLTTHPLCETVYLPYSSYIIDIIIEKTAYLPHNNILLPSYYKPAYLLNNLHPVNETVCLRCSLYSICYVYLDHNPT